MKKNKVKTAKLADYIKANRKGSREAEIENHNRPVSHNRVHVSKKVYNRKRNKADFKDDLPYFFYIHLLYHKSEARKSSGLSSSKKSVLPAPCLFYYS